MTRTRDPFDELAAMFLTERDEPASQGSSAGPAKSASIELLIVAHLPVRGGLWLTPYADAVARTGGPVALVRLDGEHPTLQQLRGAEPTGAPPTDLTLREAIGELMPSTPAWIVRAPAKTSATKMLQAGADRITILTSADDAAVVAAYQAIKNLLDDFDADVGCLPPIGVAVVGADEEKARDMVARLNATAEAHLGITVPMTLCLPRMDAGILSTRYLSFTNEDCPPLGKVVRMIDETRRGVGRVRLAPPHDEGPWHPAAPAVESAPASPGEAVQVAAAPVQPTVAAVDEFIAAEVANDVRDEWLDEPVTPTAFNEAQARIDEDLIESDVEFLPRMPGIVEVLRAKVDEEAFSVAPEWMPEPEKPRRPTMKVRPKPVLEVEPKQSLDAREPAADGGRPMALAEHVDGLIPILPRCPGHERVELALDAAGRMHLLTQEDFLRELFVVEPWARAHRELIGMACSGRTIDPRGRIVKHIFTARPIDVSDLHQSDLRLHVLAPVKVKGETGWYSAPLNAAASG